MKTIRTGQSLAVATVFASTILFGASANADTIYNFTWTGTNFDATGTAVVSDALDSAGDHDILSITGNVTGPVSGAITGLIPNSNPGQEAFFASASNPGGGWNYDNVAFPSTSSSLLDDFGVLFRFGTNDIGNIYFDGSGYFFSADTPTSLFIPGDPGQFEMSAAAGPVVGAGLPGLIAALGGLVALARRRRRKRLG